MQENVDKYEQKLWPYNNNNRLTAFVPGQPG